jgi:hypothetical protein
VSPGNTIAGGDVSQHGYGIRLLGSCYNTFYGNTIGLTRDGMSALGCGHIGMSLACTTCIVRGSNGNIIGGSRGWASNGIGAVMYGVEMANVGSNTIQGNDFGLLSDGDTTAPCRTACLVVRGGSYNNLIGGGAAEYRNVFVTMHNGIEVLDAGTFSNKIRGNYFGLNAAGTTQRRCICGVYVGVGVGANHIGGHSADVGNWFTPKGPGVLSGVWFEGGGGGSLVKSNTFGVRPDGVNATTMSMGVMVKNVSVNITDNEIARAVTGISAMQSSANPSIYRNKLRLCDTAIRLDTNASADLGDATATQGRNIFRPTNGWHIYNNTPNPIKAEGNWFGTTSEAAINDKIHDHRDNAGLGFVDFDPLRGGVHPSGQTAPLALASTTAVPTKVGGAEVAFSLSTSADVTITVLNIAGRPVATVCRDREATEGLQRVIWSGQTAQGTRAPSGMYLVRITARDPDGAQASGLCTLRLER